jgi:hypothetical protein
MTLFLLAIFIGLVIRSVSVAVINNYVRSKTSKEELSKKTGFHVAVLTYLINGLLLKISIVVLIALMVKEYLL